MRATGIVRRVDDLGRIIIPKEVRRQLKITENTPMELFIDHDKIVFQKYVATTDFEKNVEDLRAAYYDVESYFDSEIAGKIEEHIKALTEILKESGDK